MKLANVVKPFILCGLMATNSVMATESKANISQQQDKKLSYTLNFTTKTAGYYEGEDSASQVLFGFNPVFHFDFGKSFWIDADVSMNLNSSRVQSRYINRNDESFVLNELAMNFNPMSGLLFTAGALNQGHLNSPFLVTSISFPGVMAKVEANINRYKIGAKAQRLIPTSTSFDSDRTSKEVLPIFQTIGIYGSTPEKSFIELTAQANIFSYSKLPSVVAFESRRLGNDVTGIDVGDSNFRYDFSGLSQSISGKINYSKSLSQNLLVSIVENKNTDDGNNRAQLLETGFNFEFSDFVLTPSIATFYAEPNVAPAFYNSRSYGNTNREGYKYSLKTKFKNYGLDVEASYIDSRVINASIFQDDLSSLQLMLEMLNVKF